MQFGFMKEKGTTDAIFIMQQVNENYIGKKKDLYFVFTDLEKTFDRVPRKVLLRSMRKLGVHEWILPTA